MREPYLSPCHMAGLAIEGLLERVENPGAISGMVLIEGLSDSPQCTTREDFESDVIPQVVDRLLACAMPCEPSRALFEMGIKQGLYEIGRAYHNKHDIEVNVFIRAGEAMFFFGRRKPMPSGL